jgi:prevent-host-death family protein
MPGLVDRGWDPGLREIDNSGRLWLYLAMKHVRIAELKDRLSEHLRAVENGAEVVVMDRNRPIARIVPFAPLDRRVRLIQPSRDFPDIRDRRRTPAGWQIPSTELLLEERRDR